MNHHGATRESVYEQMLAHEKETGVPATVREIQEFFGFRSPRSAAYHMGKLADEGLLKRSTGRRAYQVVERPSAKKKCYISGPMSGLPDLNFPAFHAAEETLRVNGYDPVNPAKITPEKGLPWEYYMRRDIAALLDCEAVLRLPGWEESRGATLEVLIAEHLGMAFIDLSLIAVVREVEE